MFIKTSVFVFTVHLSDLVFSFTNMKNIVFEIPVLGPSAKLLHSYLLQYRKLVVFFCVEKGRGKFYTLTF